MRNKAFPIGPIPFNIPSERIPKKRILPANVPVFKRPAPLLLEYINEQPEESFYSILGLRPGASVEEISSAYRRLAKIYHPDKKPSGDKKIFEKIHNAYYALTHPDIYISEQEDKRNREERFAKRREEGLQKKKKDEEILNLNKQKFEFEKFKLQHMNLSELKQEASKLGFSIPSKLKKPDILAFLINFLSEMYPH